ncbi:MAG: hypothetical protein K8L99_26135 [Anaerolineae bacterium]|nr:hypothetical protein [Anaerolineae bacterium]
MSELIEAFIETGILQFGSFGPDQSPMRFNFHLLPSYPDILQMLIDRMQPLVGDVNRLLCSVETMPIGIGLSLQSGIPLVYSQGNNEAAVYDLVGAYDIGHPAALVINILANDDQVNRLVASARGVGLNIHHILAIVDFEYKQTSIECRSLVTISEMLTYLRQNQHLRAPHLQVIERWLSHHQG